MKKIMALLLCLLMAALPALAEETEREYATVDGESITLSRFEGQKVVVTMWASWCGWCLKELPAIQKLHEDYPDAVILAVNCGDPAWYVADFMEKNGYTFTAVIDEEEYMITRVFPSRYFPYLVVLDETGEVIYEHTGYDSELCDTLLPYMPAENAEHETENEG